MQIELVFTRFCNRRLFRVWPENLWTETHQFRTTFLNRKHVSNISILSNGTRVRHCGAEKLANLEIFVFFFGPAISNMVYRREMCPTVPSAPPNFIQSRQTHRLYWAKNLKIAMRVILIPTFLSANNYCCLSYGYLTSNVETFRFDLRAGTPQHTDRQTDRRTHVRRYRIIDFLQDSL